jgi:hypothetical protein
MRHSPRSMDWNRNIRIIIRMNKIIDLVFTGFNITLIYHIEFNYYTFLRYFNKIFF